MGKPVILMLIWLAGAPVAQAQPVLHLGTAHAVVGAGETITIGIRVENVTGLRLAHLFLEYDSTVIRFESATIGGFMAGAFFHHSGTARNGSASLLLDAAILGREASVSGSGTICCVRFSGIRTGLSRLACDDLRLLDTANRTLACRVVEGSITVEDPNGAICTGEAAGPGFYLSQNYPNPFNSVTTIEYGLAGRMTVALDVYNVLGQFIGGSGERTEEAGAHRFRFDGSGLPSGGYFYRIRARDAAGRPGPASLAVKRLVIQR